MLLKILRKRDCAWDSRPACSYIGASFVSAVCELSDSDAEHGATVYLAISEHVGNKKETSAA